MINIFVHIHTSKDEMMILIYVAIETVYICITISDHFLFTDLNYFYLPLVYRKRSETNCMGEQ